LIFVKRNYNITSGDCILMVLQLLMVLHWLHG